MSTTFAQLRTELMARGYDYLGNDAAGLTRANRWINQAYLSLCSEADFRFLFADASGTSPLTISDLDTVLSVNDATNHVPIVPWDRRTLIEAFGDLTTTGTPFAYWLDDQSTLRVFPVSTDITLNVRYVKVPAQLVNDSDTVVVPDRWIDLIVDGAVLKAKKDDDTFDALLQNYQQDLQKMIAVETISNVDSPDYIVVVPGAATDAIGTYWY